MSVGLTCPSCDKETLAPIAGQFETGVIAPDGYRETVYEEGYQCTSCGAFTGDDELDEPSAIPCSKCGLPTTWDTTYGDLCYRCCRTSNE